MIPGERLPCVVPFCRRTIARVVPTDTECICQRHFRLCLLKRRRRYSQRRAQLAAAIEVNLRCAREHGGLRDEDVDEEMRLRRIVQRLWGALKQEAIGKAMST